MRDWAGIAVIIPALNEEQSIGKVISAVPQWVDQIIVVDNGSTDCTARAAEDHGARVVHEPRRGYGSACLKGMECLDEPDIVVFLDGDFSDHPDEMGLIVDPIVRGEADMVLGSRVLGPLQPGALTPQARFGNLLACSLMRLLWGVKYTDLGPFRAIRYSALRQLRMRDTDYGWTIEMQIKAAIQGLQIQEAPVSYRKRIGKSKISGTIKGAIAAGTTILGTIFLFAIRAFPGGHGPASQDRLIIFTRYPAAGTTKTRLIPALGAQGAAEIQRRMTEHILSRVRRLNKDRAVSIEVRYKGGSKQLMMCWLGPDASYKAQREGDLGERTHHAFVDSFDKGAARVVLIGSDCPGMSMETVERAFDRLRNHDLVLGPANDGGYYLVGLRRPYRRLFLNIPWGTDRVLRETLKIANDHKLAYALLEPLDDVDRPQDIRIWEEIVQQEGASKEEISRVEPPARISVIIPTLNEAAGIQSVIARVLGEENVDIIVVDGGSEDNTMEIARRLNVQVITTSGRRARQMNAGAEHATGAILLFLHADTRLPMGWSRSVREELDRPGTAAGAFELQIDQVFPWSRIIEKLANLRSRLFQMPYGDQAVFVKADLFRGMGGYRDMPIMEDYEFIRRARRNGRIRIAPCPAMTSARRWTGLGPLRATLVNQIMLLGYWLGVSPHSLRRLYIWGSGGP